MCGSPKAKKRVASVWCDGFLTPFARNLPVRVGATSMATPFGWLHLLGSPKRPQCVVRWVSNPFRTGRDYKYGYPFWVATPSGQSQGKEASPQCVVVRWVSNPFRTDYKYGYPFWVATPFWAVPRLRSVPQCVVRWVSNPYSVWGTNEQQVYLPGRMCAPSLRAQSPQRARQGNSVVLNPFILCNKKT